MTSARTNVIVIGGDPAVGRSLESLLQAAGYHARFRPEPSADELDELLADSCLLLIVPGLSTLARRAFQHSVLRPGAPVKIPIVELLSADGGEQLAQLEHVVPWPCSIEELKRVIDAALLVQE